MQMELFFFNIYKPKNVNRSEFIKTSQITVDGAAKVENH